MLLFFAGLYHRPCIVIILLNVTKMELPMSNIAIKGVVQELPHEMYQTHEFKMDINYNLYVSFPDLERWQERKLKSEYPSPEERNCIIHLHPGEENVSIRLSYSNSVAEHSIGDQETAIEINDANELQNEPTANKHMPLKRWMLIVIFLTAILYFIFLLYKVC